MAILIGALGIAGLALLGSQVPAALSPVAPPRTVGQVEAAAPPTPMATLAPRTVPKPALPIPKQAAPTPVPPPVPTVSGQQLLASLRSDLAAQWVQNHRETPLRAGPSEQSAAFTTLPQWTRLRVMDTRDTWAYVYFQGDSTGRQPGPGWVKLADVGAVGTPTAWLSTAKQAPLWVEGSPLSKRVLDLPAGARLDLPAGARMEVLNAADIQGTRIQVRLPGDGRTVPPSQGWIDADSVTRMAAPSPQQLPIAYPRALQADLRLPVPYRTQLDGSPFAQANCGPTALGMVLESLGVNLTPRALRGEVLKAEDEDEWNDDDGSFIWALAKAAESNGVKAHGLYESDGERLRRWSVEDVRAELKQGRPVIAQVYYRALPGRGDSLYYGDHYVVLTGLMDESFLYNDPIGGPEANEAPGWDRVMTAAQLQRAMDASDRPYAYTAFGVGRS